MYPAPVRHPSAGVSDMQSVKTHSLNTHPSITTTTSHTHTPPSSTLPPIHVKNQNYIFCTTLQMYILTCHYPCFFFVFSFFSHFLSLGRSVVDDLFELDPNFLPNTQTHAHTTGATTTGSSKVYHS